MAQTPAVEFPNPPIATAAPTPGQGLVYNPVDGGWDPAGPAPASTPSGFVVESFSRKSTPASDVSAALTTGTVLVVALDVPAGLVISNLTFVSGATAGSGMTHQWAALLDASQDVLAVSADATTAAWAANSEKTFALGTPYEVQAAGTLWAALLVAESAGAVPSLMCKVDGTTALNKIAPVQAATSSTGQTTPPAVAATLGALTAVVNKPYCLVS